MSRSRLSVVLALFAGYCLLAPVVPVADDELYYWCWSESLQLSYYDHPPMTALMIRAATAAFGDTLFAVRLPACVATAGVFAAILYLTRPRRVAWWLLATPLFTLGAVIVTPDTPLLLFWAAYVVWLVEVHERLTPAAPSEPERERGPPERSEGVRSPDASLRSGGPRSRSGSDGHVAPGVPLWLWAVGGVLLGCGVLGKYTTGLAVPAGFLAFLLAGSPRRWLAGYVFHGVVAFAVASPILVHNIHHDFVPLTYQWRHSMGTTDPSLKRFGEFVSIQILLVGTMPVALFPWVLANWRRLAATPRLRVCLCLYGFPFAFFLYKAARGPLEGNWALASYVAFWPLAADWYERVRHRRAWRVAAPLSFALPGLVVVAAAIHLVKPIAAFPPRADRVHRQTAKGEVAEQIAARLRAEPERLPVFMDTYQWVALMRFHGADARQLAGVTRPSHFTQRPERLTDADRAYVIWEGTPPPHLTVGFGPPEHVATFPLAVRGELLTGFLLWRYTKQSTAAVTPTGP